MRWLGLLPRLLLVVAAGALLLTATVVGIAPRVWSTANAHEELPVVLPEFEALAQRTYVYDVNGQEIAFYELENSQPIAYEDIPQPVIDAFLVVEDKEFFTHDGINIRSLVRATLSNFASDAPQQGASTITMQVAKNDFLAGLERDGRYKLLQMHYARMLEKQMSKEDIMARYLNTVFFGNNAYGIEAAAETYFAKSAFDLTFIESAFLAGLVRSPSGFDPINEPERSRARWLQVIERLVDEEELTEAEGEQLAEEFVLPSRVAEPARSFVLAHLLHRGPARLPPEPDRHSRRHLSGALQPTVPWRSAHPHHPRRQHAGTRRTGPQRTARHPFARYRFEVRRIDRVARFDLRGHPGDGRRARLRAQRA